MQTLLSLLVGIGLSAACGFRVFVPLLVVNLAAHAGQLKLSPGFEWMGSDLALIAFAVATVLEVVAYYVPWVDNLLDSIATPAAVIAGTLVTASLVTDMSPFLRWSLALIAGGGIAGLVQGSTVVARGVSTGSTGGLANPLLATIELGSSLITSLLSLVVPVLVVALIAVLLLWFGLKAFKRRSGPAAT